MEECESPPARFRRRAWAQSRDSWQTSESRDQGAEEPLSAQPMEDKTSTASETGHKPNQVENWLRTCRTPLGASLDEQSGSPSRVPLKNGCSFEDDLSLGAEANHLQNSSTKTEANGYEMAAEAKRSQFKQKGRSMNSTGSGKSSTTVSSVSELLDLYEEDPEEILYNLGFGREEPDIASKIPSRFFNSSSYAKGIDIKVYLGAQIQRMELENPNYALTSRFRQTEVLATVANVFSEIYSQVSGRPMERIGSADIETKTPSPLKRNNSALNAVKILKRNITKPNLLASVMEGTAKQPSASDADNEEGANSDVRAGLMDTEQKLQQKVFRKKDSSLATVTEEAQQSISDTSLNGNVSKPTLMNGDHSTETPALDKDMSLSPVLVSISRVSDTSDFKELEHQKTITSTPDKEPTNLLPNPLIAHLLSQPRDSFEMEELQTNEDEALPGPGGTSQAGSERFLRTTSQQSDSSGFAEDPSTEVSGNHLKVQESSDSCDSETTVTSHAGEVRTPIALEFPNFERLQGVEAHPQSNRGTFSQSGTNREVPEITSPQSPNPNSDNISPNGPLLSPDCDRASIVESNFTTAQEPTTDSPEVDLSTMVDPATDSNLDVAHEVNIGQPGLGIDLDSSEDLRPSSGPESSDLPETLDLEQCHSTTQRRQMDLQTAHQRSSSMDEERPGRVWVRDRILLRESLERSPLRRSSSLPTSPLSPARVVTSMRIQLGKGSVKHCTPPSYSYHYDEENRSVQEEVDSIMEKDEVDHSGGQSELLKSAPAGGSKMDRGTPPHLLNVPQHLTRSSSSLYSVPADWPQRPLGEGPNWSTCSVPNLNQFTGLPHPPPPTPPHGSFYSPQHGVAYNSLYPTGVPHHTPFPQPQSSPYPQPLKSNTFTPPQGAPFTPQHNMHYAHPHSVPFSPFYSPYNVPQGAPYGPSLDMHGSPYQPHFPLAQSHSAPYRPGYNGSPHHPGAPYSHPYYPSPPFPCSFETPPAPVPAMGSTEMQLRKVLHEIRGTMQNLGQSSSVHGGDTPIDRISTPCSVQPLYEELQMRRKSLNVFRTQMMDLELALMRQQSMVYQHLSPDERREAEQLEGLRMAVRQELQELELQLEDHLLSLNEQMRSSSRQSSLYRHHMGMHRGHSMESLSNSSALRAMEPVTNLLKEQLYLQSELGYEAATPSSGRSSRASSPGRFNRTLESCSPPQQRGNVYRATLNLTPTIPARPGMEVPRPVSPERMEQNMTPASLELSRDEDEMSLDGHRSRTTEDCSPTEWRSRSGGNGDLQHLIQEIKESIAHEIRQEIVNELLAAVSPRRSPLPARKPPV
ncbi:protein ITPRID2-like isoform X1 [Cyprinus carpio]|uniref:ITPR interacting domain containing 2 n=3 Tax=Cyprinus carpio TaxID=7962 RepID=A0A8C1N4P6_CYPCA|nr:protein ITPRID2-like isoform X1 [Cyprinus carpio]XP_042620146.1 protein ITPRID2-like isoform X1 [Cyprinus carpio]